jgi:hypothetical protein
MGKGGSESESKSVTKLPEWYVKYAKDALALSNKIAQTGYTRYGGPEVAGFNPQQVAGMQGAQDFSSAFAGAGAPRQQSVAKQLMPQTNFGNGLSGYSSGPGYDRAIKEFAKKQPGQYKYIKGFSINPKTGKLAPKYANIMKTDKDDPLGPIYNPTYRPDPGNPGAPPQYAWERFNAPPHNEHQ